MKTLKISKNTITTFPFKPTSQQAFNIAISMYYDSEVDEYMIVIKLLDHIIYLSADDAFTAGDQAMNQALDKNYPPEITFKMLDKVILQTESIGDAYLLAMSLLKYSNVIRSLS